MQNEQVKHGFALKYRIRFEKSIGGILINLILFKWLKKIIAIIHKIKFISLKQLVK